LNDGSFLVSDGYCNSRVLRFNPDGSVHSEYKLAQGSGQQHKDMVVPHSLVVDECDDTLMVADRENRAVHTFKLSTREYMRKCLTLAVLDNCLSCILRITAESSGTGANGCCWQAPRQLLLPRSPGPASSL
jgi:hypothetical protein